MIRPVLHRTLALAALGTAATVGAQGMTVTPTPVPAPTHVAPAPIYIVPVQPRDPRTPRERCRDAEVARLGSTPSDLDLQAIDLKCSQR